MKKQRSPAPAGTSSTRAPRERTSAWKFVPNVIRSLPGTKNSWIPPGVSSVLLNGIKRTNKYAAGKIGEDRRALRRIGETSGGRAGYQRQKPVSKISQGICRYYAYRARAGRI